MKNKIVILICTTGVALENKISRLIYDTFPEPLYEVHLLKETKLSAAKQIIEHEPVDILVTTKKLSDRNSEVLIKFSIKRNPTLPIIVVLEEQDDQTELYLRRTYRKNMYCVVQDKLLEGLTAALVEAYDEVINNKSRRIMFPSAAFNITDLCYVKSNGNYVEATIYDVNKHTFFTADKKMTMKAFMEMYNGSGDFIRCHASWIVNKRMIKRLYEADNYLVLAFDDEHGDDLQIPIGVTYRAAVLEQLKGVY